MEDDDGVAAPLSFHLVRDQAVEPRRGLPVDPAGLVPRNVLPQSPELRTEADPAGGNLPHPPASASRSHPRLTQVLQRWRYQNRGPHSRDDILVLQPRGPRAPRHNRTEDVHAFEAARNRVGDDDLL